MSASGRGRRGFAGAAGGPAGLALLCVEAGQLVGVDQAYPIRADRGQRALLDVTPEDDARHADLFRGLGNCQQPSFLHSGNRSRPAALLTGYTRCRYPARMRILETQVTNKEASPTTRLVVPPAGIGVQPVEDTRP